MNRRSFLINSGIASSAMVFPNFLTAGIQNIQQNYNDKKLVVVQLSGGNDGLNTIIPFGNDRYYNLRPTLSIHEDNTLKISDYFGLHPSLHELRTIYDKGEWAIINNVGYPNPDRSHFRSMDIWQTASGSDQYLKTGWLGRYLDHNCIGSDPAHKALEINEHLSLALKGEKWSGFVMKDPNTLKKSLENPFTAYDNNNPGNSNLDYLYKVLRNTSESAEYLYEKSKIYQSNIEYPNNAFAKQLKMIAELINSGNNSSIYYVSLSGFDTHVNQKAVHSRLLKRFAEGMAAFIKDLESGDTYKDTLIMCFSEFGRRVKQNASFGTDHGTANNVFIFGKNLSKPGLQNQDIDLEDLDEGDLKYRIDFRQVYADILNNWLDSSSIPVLIERFNPLGIV